ncbi:hypothetical protein HD806DRAFT_108496 [Xylariaceae sp. AK1471]|nr:hypothetical protein HD806DRAFT_108496 [Xylariaceae sp. AK1471]
MIPNFRYLGVLLLATVPLSTAIYPWKPSDCPTCSKPKHCSNAGWDWAYYPSPLHNDGENYPGFLADVFKTREPSYTDVTPAIGGLTRLGADGTIYGSSAVLNNTYFVLNHHAYLWACETGTWQFDITGVDDLVLGWVGDVAYSGWTDNNADARAVWTFLGSAPHVGSASFTTNLNGGSFVPIRFVFADAQGGGNFRLTITSPSGIIVHQTGRETNNDWIVRFSCPFSPKAPRFPEFGKES